jgi:flagellar hook-length control protein FliK
MHAMSFLSGLVTRATGAPGLDELPGDGLQTALALPPGADSGFPGELIALLQGLSPPMLQRLQEMVAGGMALPQAARQLLADGGPEAGSVFDARLPEKLADLQADLVFGGRKEAGQGALNGLSTGQMAGLARALPPSVDAAAAATVLLPLSAQGQALSQPANQLMSPQLAHSLLDMGVPQTVGGRAWQGAIGERVLWMAQGDQQFARLTLNPPHLGPLEVRVTVSQDQTSVLFLAHQAAVREALDAALPRLRELFDQQSLSLAHAEVADPGSRQHDPRQSSPGGGSAGGPIGGQAVSDEPDGGPLLSVPVVTAKGLVDLFV